MVGEPWSARRPRQVGSEPEQDAPAGRLASGSEVTLSIDGLASRGEGVGRVDGLALFVAGALPGETVRCRIGRVTRSYARAELVAVETASTRRVAPPCPHQSECGGCPLMILDARDALAAKTTQLTEALRRIGGISHVVDRSIPSPEPLGYRGRVRFAVGAARRPARLGFRPRGGRGPIATIDTCLLAPPETSALARRILARLDDDTPASGRPWPSELEIRRSRATGDHLAIVRGPPGRWPEAVTAARDLLADETRLIGVVRLSAVRDGSFQTTCMAGSDALVERIAGIEIELGATSFVQVNLPVAEQLYREIRSGLSATGGERILDLYSGSGVATLVATDERCEVVGVEIERQAVERGRRALRRTGRRRCELIAGDVESVLDSFTVRGERFDRAVMNPPRSGVGSGLPRVLANLGVQRVVIVSCHPATLARDVARMVAERYRLTRLTALDMFPQTAHIEAVACLERRP